MSEDILQIENQESTFTPGPVYFWAILGYFFVEYVRPQSFVSAIGALRPGLLAQGFLLILLFTYPKKRPLPTPFKVLIGFLALMLFDILFAVNKFWAYQGTKDILLLFVAVCIPIYFFIEDARTLDRLLTWFLAFNGIVAVNAIFKAGTGVGSFLKDENDLSMALCVVFPIAMFKLMAAKQLWPRLFYLTLVGLYLMGIISSISRGGFVGLITVGLWIALRSPRKALIISLMIVAALFVLLVAPPSYWHEMGTIDNAVHGADTGGTRLYFWSLAVKMWMARPLNGWGAKNFEFTAYRFQGNEQYGFGDAPMARTIWGKSVHSVYFTVLSEFGTIGILLFGFLIVYLFRMFARVRRDIRYRLDRHPDEQEQEQATLSRIRLLGLGLEGALVGYLSTGTFLSAFYYPHFWILLALGLTLEKIWRTLPPISPISTEEATT